MAGRRERPAIQPLLSFFFHHFFLLRFRALAILLSVTRCLMVNRIQRARFCYHMRG